jgi:hypothetical protein
VDHVLDCIAAATAYAYDFDKGSLVENFFFYKFNGHVRLLMVVAAKKRVIESLGIQRKRQGEQGWPGTRQPKVHGGTVAPTAIDGADIIFHLEISGKKVTNLTKSAFD